MDVRPCCGANRSASCFSDCYTQKARNKAPLKVVNLSTLDVGNLIEELRECVAKLESNGITPDTLKLNKALLAPEIFPYVIAECERLGIKYRIW